MMAIINTRHELSVVIVNAHAMGWGAMTSILIALVLGRPMAILLTPEYLWSLLYLSIFGSSIAFVCYLSLLKRIGGARAAFSSVLFPIVALLMSTFFEDFQWTRTAIIGIALTLAGNWLALTKTNAQPDSTK
jgi:drug/metabolite transporter (DMT)-like permease